MYRIIAALVCILVLAGTAWSDETVSISKTDLDAIKAKIVELEQELQQLKANLPPNQPSGGVEPSAPENVPQTPETAPAPTEPAGAPSAGGRHLALPDISLIVQAKGKATSDSNDPAKQKLQLTEAELGIQGYVYPNVKADAFITGSPSEDEPFQVEEAYLTYLGPARGLNLYVGEKHVAFGRTNLLHNHSWLYARQPLVISDFIAGESLAGQGLETSYLIPTRGNLFAQLDLGTWANGTEGEESNLPDIVVGPGANVTDRFSTARLWGSYPVSQSGELEFGGSWLGGKSNDDPSADPPVLTDRVHITGVDLTYRHFGERNQRLLLRGECFWRRGTTDDDGAVAKGYYLLGNYRMDKYNNIGLLYDWSEFPQSVGSHESAMSLIYTKQFSEQYYLRLQAIHGSRPDDASYNEFWLQWVWGVGPHTHNLE